MIYKRLILVALAFLCTLTISQAQSKQDTLTSILNAPDGWIKERIPFPLSFAPSLPYKSGFEDLRFATGWRDSTSNEFWTYAFVWKLEDDPTITSEKLETQVKAYYDGLMGVSNTVVLFLQDNDSKNNTRFIGKMSTKDAFFTKKSFTLNLKVQTSYCEKTNSYFVLAQVSSKEFEHTVWDTLETVTLKDNCKE